MGSVAAGADDLLLARPGAGAARIVASPSPGEARCSGRPSRSASLILLVFILSAIFAPIVAPYDPAKPDYQALLQTPSGDHLFGTDDKGRDIFSRVVYGTRISFTIAVVAVGIAAVIGIPLGLFAGFFGGWADAVTGRFVDALFAFPVLLMAIAIVTITGIGLKGAIIAIGLIAIPEFARVSRSAMIAEKENDYVLAARTVGSSVPRIIFRQILPNTLGPIVVLISLGFAFAILNETALCRFSASARRPPFPRGAPTFQRPAATSATRRG